MATVRDCHNGVGELCLEQEYIIEYLRQVGLHTPEYLTNDNFVDEIGRLGFELPAKNHYSVYAKYFAERWSSLGKLVPIAKSETDDDVLAIKFADAKPYIVVVHDYSDVTSQDVKIYRNLCDWLSKQNSKI